MKKLIIPNSARIAWNTIENTVVQRDDQESIFLATFDDIPSKTPYKFQIDYSFYNRGKYKKAPKFVLRAYKSGEDYENYDDTINYFDKEYENLSDAIDDINYWMDFFKDNLRIEI
jgi:hypothetical protein